MVEAADVDKAAYDKVWPRMSGLEITMFFTSSGTTGAGQGRAAGFTAVIRCEAATCGPRGGCLPA